MKLSINSFGLNPRIIAKFQADRFQTFRENPGEKKIKKPPSKTYTLAAATLRYADAAGLIMHNDSCDRTHSINQGQKYLQLTRY